MPGGGDGAGWGWKGIGGGKKRRRKGKDMKKKSFNPMLAMIKKAVADNPLVTVEEDEEDGGSGYKAKRDTYLNAQRIAKENLAKRAAADRAAREERARQERIQQRAAELQKQAMEHYNAEQARLALEQEAAEREERRRQMREFQAKLHERELRRQHREWRAINMAGQVRAIHLSRYEHRFDGLVKTVQRDREGELRRTRRRAKRKEFLEKTVEANRRALAEWEARRAARERAGMALEERLQRMEWWELENYHEEQRQAKEKRAQAKAKRRQQRQQSRDSGLQSGGDSSASSSDSEHEEARFVPFSPDNVVTPQRPKWAGATWKSTLEATLASTGLWSASASSRQRRPSTESVESRGWHTRDVAKPWPRPRTAGVLQSVPTLSSVPVKRRPFYGLSPAGRARSPVKLVRSATTAGRLAASSPIATGRLRTALNASRTFANDSDEDEDGDMVRPSTANVIAESELDAAFGVSAVLKATEETKAAAVAGGSRMLFWDKEAFRRKELDKTTKELQERLKKEQKMKRLKRQRMRRWETQEDQAIRLPSVWELQATRSNPG